MSGRNYTNVHRQAALCLYGKKGEHVMSEKQGGFVAGKCVLPELMDFLAKCISLVVDAIHAIGSRSISKTAL